MMSPSEAMQGKAPPQFVGDGNYVGDGGELLQQLWDFAQWKMIRNCPGRYVIKHGKRSPFSIDGVPVTSIETGAFVREALAASSSSSSVEDESVSDVVVHDLLSLKCVDRVKVVVFGAGGSGGGVITYCKRENPTAEDIQEECRDVYVHTLNTASGLRRKLGGLQIAHLLDQ